MFRTLYIISLLIVTYPVSADINGRIVRVLDGDTVEILGEGNQLKRVRLAGIDAPEKNQPFGQRSRQERSALSGRASRLRRSGWLYVLSPALYSAGC